MSGYGLIAARRDKWRFVVIALLWNTAVFALWAFAVTAGALLAFEAIEVIL